MLNHKTETVLGIQTNSKNKQSTQKKQMLIKSWELTKQHLPDLSVDYIQIKQPGKVLRALYHSAELGMIVRIKLPKTMIKVKLELSLREAY